MVRRRQHHPVAGPVARRHEPSRDDRPIQADGLQRRPDELRVDAGGRPASRTRTTCPRCACASRPASPCPPPSGTSGSSAPATRSSRASGRRRTSPSTSRIGWARHGPAAPASRSRATRSGSSTTKGGRCRRGETGNLLVRGETAALAYLHQYERSRRTFLGEWLATGDRFYEDADGLLLVRRALGRHAQGGRYLGLAGGDREHPDQATRPCWRARSSATRIRRSLIKPKAFVVLHAGYSPSDEMAHELIAYCARELAAFKRPRWIEFVDELPRTATGKLQRSKLREADHAYTLALDAISKDDFQRCGGKGANLGELTPIGARVPPGFCITSDALRLPAADATRSTDPIAEVAARPGLRGPQRPRGRHRGDPRHDRRRARSRPTLRPRSEIATEPWSATRTGTSRCARPWPFGTVRSRPSRG